MIKHIYIDASSIAEARPSGIGQATVEIVRALERHSDNGKTFDIVLAIAYDKREMLNRWNLGHVKYKKIFFPMRALNLLWKHNLLPPMDIFLGRGVYVFPNYKNWWLLFSKSITYVHDIGFILYPQFVEPKNQKFLKKNMQKWLERTSIIATDSKSARKDIISYYNIPEHKIQMLYHGVDTSVYYPRHEKEVYSVKKKYKIEGEYLFYLGNIEPRKNLIRLLDAYEEITNELQRKFALVIVGGSGWLDEPIKEKIKALQGKGLNIIKPEVFVVDEDLPALHTGATVLVHPALYEGFGLSILQALACGTPVVAGNNSSMPEVVGEAGLLVDANNTEDISAKIEKILLNKELRKKLSAEGLKQAKKFSWNSTANKLINLARSIDS